jgi:hypothetical protein
MDWGSAGEGAKRARVLSFWCFSPGFAMRNLMQQHIHSLILTSTRKEKKNKNNKLNKKTRSSSPALGNKNNKKKHTPFFLTGASNIIRQNQTVENGNEYFLSLFFFLFSPFARWHAFTDLCLCV